MLSMCKPICKYFKKSVTVYPIIACNMCLSGISHLTQKECGHYLCTRCLSVCNKNNIECVVCYKQDNCLPNKPDV